MYTLPRFDTRRLFDIPDDVACLNCAYMSPLTRASVMAGTGNAHRRGRGGRRTWRPYAIERLHEEFKRRIKTQTVVPSADTAAMLFWALLASGQIVMRKIDGWNTLSTVSSDQPQLDAAA